MERLSFTILSYSGEDQDFRAVNLAQAGPQNRGWQSSKNCGYPQELVIGLSNVRRVQQIQLLSHEYKIASKLELYVGTIAPGSADTAQPSWRRLGSLTFDSNERSKYQARELKSVHVDEAAQLLRVVLHRPHPNQFNVHKQVGIATVTVHGRPAEGPSELQAFPSAVAPARLPDLSWPGLASSGPAASAAALGVDATTAHIIAELNVKKGAAVAEENYDLAKALKLEVDRLRALGSKVLELELRKQKAIEEEDYDTAKAIKGQIADLRAGGARKTLDEVVIRVDATAHGSSQMSPDTPVTLPAARRSRATADLVGSPPQEYDERPAQATGQELGAGGADPAEQEAAEEAPAADADPGPEPRSAPLSGGSGRERLPEGWPGGLPLPELLSAADAKEADDISELLGPYVAAALYSRHWQLREAALQQLVAFLGKQGADKQQVVTAFPAATRAIQRAIKERVPNVLQAGLQVLHQLVEAGAKAAPRDAASLTSDVLPTLLEKIGDSNARIQNAASDAILHLAQIKESGLAAMAGTFVRQPRQTAWRPVLARLHLLASLIPVWGISTNGGEGLPLEGLMKFVGTALRNANAEVRSAAGIVTVLAYNKVGPAVEKLLPRDINPKIKEQIDAAIRSAGSPPVPAAAKRRSSEGSKQAPADRRKSSGSQHGGSSEGPQPKAPKAQAAAPAASHIHLEELEASVSMEDPVPYQLELASREQILGSNHPEVAVSLSNLAILHNQRGEYALAQPLYERALTIFELNFGPFDANVAHTLTDLAVLHLEQGNIEAGRPLLERALEIQEKALGPNHPDVVAIRDVLEDRDD